MPQSGRLLPRQRLLLELWRRFRKNEARIHQLNYLFWECTLRCNLDCLHCGSDCQSVASVPDMPANAFLDVLRDLKQNLKIRQLTVVMTGGEPLLRHDLEETGMKIRELGYRWSLVTNGHQLTPERLNSLLNAGLGAITVSLDGLKAEHDWLRNHEGSYERTLTALKHIAQSTRLQSDVVTCVNRRNLESLDKIHSLLADIGIKAWRLFTITPIGRAADQTDLQLNGTQFNQLQDFIAKKRDSGQMPLTSFSCESYTGQWEGKVRDGLYFCRAGIQIGSVLANGDISACPNIDRSLVQGNIYHDSFSSVWIRRFKPFRNRRWTRTGICAECRDYRYCEGSGLHWWNYHEKRMVGPGGCIQNQCKS